MAENEEILTFFFSTKRIGRNQVLLSKTLPKVVDHSHHLNVLIIMKIKLLNVNLFPVGTLFVFIVSFILVLFSSCICKSRCYKVCFEKDVQWARKWNRFYYI